MIAEKLRMTEKEFDVWVRTLEGSGAEFVDGEVVLLGFETRSVCDLRDFMVTLLRHLVVEQNRGKVLQNYDSHLRPGLRRLPDILIVSPEDEPRLEETHIVGGPSVAIELVSKGSSRRDRVHKRHDYEEFGVREYWILDRRRREAVFYHRGEDGCFHLLPVVDDAYHSHVIPGLWLRPSWLWQEPLPSTLKLMRDEYRLI